jgi:hypothetical protein
MPATARFSQLSIPRQGLIRLCQATNYGQIHDLAVREREPVLTGPAPEVILDIRLDREEGPRDELAVADFELCAEVGRLMSLLDGIQHGKISKLEVRAGIPRRILLEKPLTGDGELMER